MPKGIDISEFQGDINIKNLDPDFVIIRYGDGGYEDIRCQQNINKCIEAGIPYGLYWLIRSWTMADAEYHASDICKFADKQKVPPAIGIWCDVEDEYDNDPEDAIPFVETFCATVEDCGYYTGIYCNQWYHDNLYPDLGRFDCWIAEWDEDPHEDPGYGTMKQYSTAGNLDRDVSFVPLSTYDIRSGKPDPEPLTLDDRVSIIERKIEEIERKLK